MNVFFSNIPNRNLIDKRGIRSPYRCASYIYYIRSGTKNTLPCTFSTWLFGYGNLSKSNFGRLGANAAIFAARECKSTTNLHTTKYFLLFFLRKTHFFSNQRRFVIHALQKLWGFWGFCGVSWGGFGENLGRGKHYALFSLAFFAKTGGYDNNFWQINAGKKEQQQQYLSKRGREKAK